MPRNIFLVFVACIVSAALIKPAAADDRKTCDDTTADQTSRLAACTRVIESGALKGADQAAAFHRRAAIYRAKRDYRRAIDDHTEALRLDPKKVEYLIVRGGSLARIGEYDRALVDLNAAVKLDPANASGFNNRGFVFNNRGEYDRALADLNEAIRISPKNAFAHKNRGISYENKGDLDKALADFRTARSLDPQNLQLAGQEATEGERRVEQKLAARAQTRPVPIPAPAAEIRIALVIGNGAYRHATKLPNPPNDAADITAALRKLGFDVVEGRDLDKRGMEDKVREFGRKLDRASLALFFYAGHGLQVGGKNYLIPTDAKLERQGDLSFETIDVGQVLAQMEAEQRVNLIFLDACRDNPLARSFARSLGTRSASVGQGLATIQSAVGTMIAYATQPDAVALDGDGRNSPFTTALLKHLATPGLEIGSLMKKVRADVVQATRSKQVPWDHSSLIGDVVLAR